MYLDHNLYDNTKVFKKIGEEDNKYVDNKILVLKTDKGENPVYIDKYGKNHLFTSKEFCLLPILENLNYDVPVNLRIEGETYNLDELENIIKLYQIGISDPSKCKDLFSNLESVRSGFTLGALTFKSI
jgi:putative protease